MEKKIGDKNSIRDQPASTVVIEKLESEHEIKAQHG